MAVENDPQWAAVVRSFRPANAIVVAKAISRDLVAEDLSGDSAFEVIIVDALASWIDGAKAGLPFLVDNGVVVWDNTDGPNKPEVKTLMASHGFGEISFSRLAPQEVAKECTTISYWRNNVFDI